SVPPYIRCAHQSALYISCPHQSAPLHQISPSHCHLTSDIPVRVPPCPQSTPFYHISPSECPFTSHVPIRVPLSTVCAYLCPLNIKWADHSVP
ncbi:unnamed protein product, partial [Staurois parvus]